MRKSYVVLLFAGLFFSGQIRMNANGRDARKSVNKREGPTGLVHLDTAGPGLKGRSAPRLISRQFSFTEGPAVDAAGNIFFTDQPNDRIWEYDTSGRLSIFLEKAGRSNGMYFDKSGSLITCADGKDELWSVSPDKKITVLVDNFKGHRLNGPNDCWVDPSGGIYFTDPYYQRPYWDRTHSDLDGEKVYYLPPGSKEPVIADGDLMQPNGIVGTPDGRYLYVADIKAGKTYRYRIRSDGSLGARKLFVSMGSDGMTLDARGNVYLTGKGVSVFDRHGKKIDQIDIPEDWTANVCFGGKDRRDLFITASAAIYIVRMPVKGVE
ncbi:MAG: SMP-30/gluconolactonase/LRE family protein [Puia sp.]|nr:SMP-30/gluconolactonase/LRE family protein [Puia sp.]